MKKVTQISISILMVFLVAGFAQAATFTFNDDTIHWDGWASDYWRENRQDVIGTPQIIGGMGVIDDSLNQLTQVSFDYTSAGSSITAGDLFIDADADTNWDYVLHTETKEIYDVTGISSSATKGVNDSFYQITGPSPNPERNIHPFAFNTNAGGSVIGSFQFTDFNTNLDDVVFWDFALDLGSEFTIAFGPTCANDVIYETVQNPVPVPAAVWLLGSGLLGLFGIKRRATKA